MTRSTSKTSFTTSDGITHNTSATTAGDSWGKPVLPSPSGTTTKTALPGIPAQVYYDKHGRYPDYGVAGEMDEAMDLWKAAWAAVDKAREATNAKGSRRTYFDATPEHKTFADDCEDTPVPLTDLLGILAFQRFAGSKGEADMINKFITPLPGVDRDKYGNYWLCIPNADGSQSATLFSSHTDTVEKSKAKGLKELDLKGTMLTTKGGGVLGADDGAGIWLMLNLIEAGIPGLYIFHREEEIGGGGSSHIAHKTPELLEGIKRAIAFDRKDLNHIITHQGGERCASDAFTKAFAAQLNDACEGFDFHGDDTGSFTDTKNYTELVPECTNLSVGYYDQHTQHECQDLSFLTRLANALIKVEWELLPTERDPKEVDDRWGRFMGGHKSTGVSQSRFSDLMDDDADFEAIVDLVADNPEEVAQILLACGYDLWGVETAIDDAKGK